MPPARTADTTAAEVQLAGVPWPMTWLECEAFAGWPTAGTETGRAPRRAAPAGGAVQHAAATPAIPARARVAGRMRQGYAGTPTRASGPPIGPRQRK
jgi:hypothetical protein